MDAPSFLLVVTPIANIFLTDVRPVHRAHAALLILLPLALEKIARGVVVHLTVALLHIILEVALEDGSALEHDLSLPVFLALQPLALVGGVIDAVLACSVSESVLHFSLIGAAIRPLVGSLSRDAVICELSLVDNPIGPDELALPIQQSIVEISLIPISILEGDLSRSVEALAVDLAVLRTGGDLTLPVIIEDLGELDR